MDPATLPLRDIKLPEPVSWWPPAPGWWLLLALLAGALLWLCVRSLRAYRRDRARRYALRTLKRLEARYDADGNAVALGLALSELVRRTMLAYAPRAGVAGLTGDAWLAWLDEGLANPQFRSGAGRALIELPYRNPAADNDDIDIDTLLYAVRMRLATPITAGGAS
ncbi:MAG: DUF4381 domain-containing protein [Pseudomonadota bacterium]